MQSIRTPIVRYFRKFVRELAGTPTEEAVKILIAVHEWSGKELLKIQDRIKATQEPEPTTETHNATDGQEA